MFTFADQVMSWYIAGREKELAQVFIDQGFDGLKNELDPQKDEEWQIIKDNFVVYSGLLIVLVVKNMKFFIDLLLSQGAQKTRAVLQIENEKYDEVWTIIMDAILDGFCRKKFNERRVEMAEKALSEILQILDSYGV